MKRPNQDVAGRRKTRGQSLDVLGQRAGRRATDEVAYCRGLYDPYSTASEDAALLEDFAEFLGGEEAADDVFVPTPDPVFKERLRRRLWRGFVTSYLRGFGKEIH